MATEGIIAVLQAVRASDGWQVTADGTSVPVQGSWIACAVAAALAWLGFSASPV